MFENRISIFTGHFGSGKTEVSVNYALKLADIGFNTTIVDLDIVNPFFRTADVSKLLENAGITVISPLYANTNADVPALPPEIYSAFNQKNQKVVFDVGGDDLGAKVLSRYREDILADDYSLYLVINTRRPSTSTAEGINEMVHEIEASSRLKVSYLVNNTNILNDTTIEIVEEGEKIIKIACAQLSIPLAFTSVLLNVFNVRKKDSGILDNEEILTLDKKIKLPWE